MIVYLKLAQVLDLHFQVIEASGGSHGVLNMGALDSALAQPQMSFGGQELYPTIAEKAAVLGFCLIQNHPFVDGNKRIGHAAMETFLVLNGFELSCPVDGQEQVILAVAASTMKRQDFTAWVQCHIQPRRNIP
jgi:death-on-curing protein